MSWIWISLALIGIAWCSIWTIEEMNRNNVKDALLWFVFTLMNCFSFCVWLNAIVSAS